MDHIRYCNEIARRLADWMVSIENFKQIQCEIPAGEILDGARLDGRPVITGELVAAMLAGDIEAAKAIAVNPATVPVISEE